MAGVESQPQRKQDRVGPARILIGLAIKYKTEKVQDNASRKKIKEMADSILAAASLSDDDRKATEGAFSSYESTWGVAPAAAAGGGADADAGLSSSDAATIDKERKRDRVGPARILIGLAGKYKTARVPDNASRKKIKEMADGILAATSLSDDDRKATEEAFASYESSWGVAPAAAAGGGADAADAENFGGRQLRKGSSLNYVFKVSSGHRSHTAEWKNFLSLDAKAAMSSPACPGVFCPVQ